ncbi:MAG TPA: inosine/xanthosine triphosphatase [Candidatus Saccharibacteria bacterium]|nr:inosine/xanthosine triphosphatase [Candidatus Saccharibacteria bacterium]
MKEIIIAVGTLREVKLEAVRQAAESIFTRETSIIGVQVESGINDQPMSQEEMLLGATNRADISLARCLDAQYGVGLEGGLSNLGGHTMDSGIVVVKNRDGLEGVVETLRMQIGHKVLDLINEGLELSDAVTQLTVHDVSSNRDAFSALSDGRISALAAYRDATICAFQTFTHPEFN